jgi:hypothetical protein
MFPKRKWSAVMSVYTVHAPPADARPAGPDRFMFVRDGFSFWAFLLGPVWMLWHGLWLVLVGYVGLVIALQVALHAIGASGTIRLAVAVLLALLLGLEAATLRRFTLARRRWTSAGTVIGDDLEAAERRFFDAWLQREEREPPRTSAAAAPAAPSEIIGLFPQPGGAR